MTTSIPRPARKVSILPKETRSLAHGLPPAEPGTLFVLGANGGMSVAPDANFRVVFGRNDQVTSHVCVGPDDPYVSREHGHIVHEGARWVLRNIGGLPIRLPGPRFVLGGDQVELPTVYTPMFIVSEGREHLLEARIAVARRGPAEPGVDEVGTEPRRKWSLSDDERLAIVCLAQRYLRNEEFAQPLTWAQVAAHLAELRPREGWTSKKASKKVDKVRHRLSRKVRGLLEKEIQPPIGNALNHNLITELLVTTTITKADLTLIDDWTEE